MKKRDIINLVKESVKEMRSFYGVHDTYGASPRQTRNLSGYPGVMEEETFNAKDEYEDLNTSEREQVIAIAGGREEDEAVMDYEDLKDKLGIEFDNAIKDYVMEDFKKQYMTKISPEDFKNKIPVGKKVLYMGGRFKVLSNNGYVLELEPREGGKPITVNLNQFSHGGQINEKNMKKLKEKTFAGKGAVDDMKRSPEYNTLKGPDKEEMIKKLQQGSTVTFEEASSNLEEEPNEGNKFGAALQKAQAAGEDSFEVDGKEYDVKEIEMTNDVGKDDYVDDEGRYAKSQIYKMGKYAMKLHDMLDDMEQLPAWLQSKITKASDYMSMVYHYLDYEFARRDGNLMEHVDKYNKRAILMERAVKALMSKFDSGATDDEIIQQYAEDGISDPKIAPFVNNTRKKWEALKKMKLDLKLADQEAEGFIKPQPKPADTAEIPGMEDIEEKKLASGLTK